MRNVVRTACLLTCLGISPAYATDYINSYVPDAAVVGEGRARVLVWDVYDAKLIAPRGQWIETNPFALELKYLQAIEGKKIADHAVEEMRYIGFKDDGKLSEWHKEMVEIFPDVLPGTIIAGIRSSSGATIFYEAGKEIGRLNDPAFTEQFFRIWLDPKTSAPTLRQSLLNLKPDTKGQYNDNPEEYNHSGDGHAS
jgi:hypothetical protein